MNRSEIIEILSNNNRDEEIFSKADKVRKQNVGDEVHLRGLIEFSNFCKCECKYCGLRFPNRKINRYRIEPEKIVEQAKLGIEIGYKTIVLQSGEDNFYSTDKMCEIIREIKKYDVALTLSIGEKTFDEYKAYKQAGADRYLLRIETTDRKLYEEMHPHSSFENRLRCLEDLKKLGYEVGSGCLVGLPNQTIDSLADDILFFKEINADMIGVGPFIPHFDTPLGDAETGSLNLALKVMALTRILLPKINIPATTAMESLLPNGRVIALNSGANVIMPNLTPVEYQASYEIYPNKVGCSEYKKYRADIETKINSIERKISVDYGNSLNK